jgi:hypothetical protein
MDIKYNKILGVLDEYLIKDLAKIVLDYTKSFFEDVRDIKLEHYNQLKLTHDREINYSNMYHEIISSNSRGLMEKTIQSILNQYNELMVLMTKVIQENKNELIHEYELKWKPRTHCDILRISDAIKSITLKLIFDYEIYDFNIADYINNITLEMSGMIMEIIHDYNYEILLRWQKLYTNIEIRDGKTYVELPLPFHILHNKTILMYDIFFSQLRVNFDTKDNTTIQNAHVLVKYIGQVYSYSEVPKDLIIEQNQSYISDISDNLLETTLNLPYHYPVIMIYFCFTQQDKLIKKNIIESVDLQINGFKLANKYMLYNNRNMLYYPDDMPGYYFIIFAKDLLNTNDDSGLINMSRIDTILLDLKFKKSTENIKSHVFALSKNILRYMHGTAGTLFNN